MKIQKDNLIEKNAEKLKEMFENNVSYEEISEQSKIIDGLVLEKFNIRIKKQN